ncbi:hypothetical protein LZC95_52445 [Pendulispora brunnea]|uniref:Uncharacterized protein n=1 Tax=Pendulispora brunnea TaxID=2905690 RepID=A0ABZ2KBT3_9BACT
MQHANSGNSEITLKIRRAGRPWFVTLTGYVIALVAALAGVVFFISGNSAAVRAELADRGLWDVQVTLQGPFAYRFSGKKGATLCTGSISRTPFSTTVTEVCQ